MLLTPRTVALAPSPLRWFPAARLAVMCFAVTFLLDGFAHTQSGARQDEAYTHAEFLVRSHRWDEGLAALEPLLTSEPRNVKALNLAALACIGKGERNLAETYFERALEVDPHFLPALKNLGIEEFQTGQFVRAEEHLQAAEKQTPNDPVVNLFLGQIDYRNQNFKLAAERLERGRELVLHDPDLVAALAVSYLHNGEKQQAVELIDRISPSVLDAQSELALGISLAQAEMASQAIPYLQAACDRLPDSYDAGFDLTLTAVEAKDFSTAIKTAESLIQHDHDTSELENILAGAQEAQGHTQLAVNGYRKAIALDPTDENNYLDFASLCIDHSAFEDGMKVITVGLDEHPKSERLTFMRGILYAMQDHFELAEKDFQEASLLAPQSDFGDVGLGITYLEIGNSDKAIQILHERLRQKPNDANLLYLLGEGLLRSGAAPGQPSYAESQTALEKSVRINPKLCLPHVSLGTIYLDENRLPEAAEQFEEARSIDPSEKSAYSHLAVAYRRLNQPDKARDLLGKLKQILDQQRAGVRVEVLSLEQEKSEGAKGKK
jgi:tetratricopeptide (TPR) repeat protein